LTYEPNQLIVAGQTKPEDAREYLYKSLHGQTFQRHFELTDYVKVSEAKMENGLLMIELVRELPEVMKPRRIEVVDHNKMSAEYYCRSRASRRLDARSAALTFIAALLAATSRSIKPGEASVFEHEFEDPIYVIVGLGGVKPISTVMDAYVFLNECRWDWESPSARLRSRRARRRCRV
jgi:hypothetical protein